MNTKRTLLAVFVAANATLAYGGEASARGRVPDSAGEVRPVLIGSALPM